ncbi:MAG: septal ring lytic transglycosylase RlpA family protein [Chlorobiaceae bacterium]|nr:septal ring lytic transglycosylase RlpA family protein [Chlorobiaceae bacterium]
MKIKQFTPKYYLSALFIFFSCAALNIGTLQAAETTEPSDPAISKMEWLPENSSASPVSSTTSKTIASAERYLVAEGKASYYAKEFHGKKTASGESFNLSHLTAAHRTLPFGTSVRVINLENGKNVVVRINDRGPHMRGRIIDVSPAAAKEIGLFGNGTANVRIEAYD